MTDEERDKLKRVSDEADVIRVALKKLNNKDN